MDVPHGTRVHLETLSSVAKTLDGLLEPGFGPIGRSTLLTTSTGQVLITNVGSSILECLNIYNPIGRMITNSVSKCQRYCGDGSKIFTLYLVSIMSHLNCCTNDSDTVYGGSIGDRRYSFISVCQHIRQKLFRNVIMPAVNKCCVTVDICENPSVTIDIMTSIVSTHLSGKYPTTTRNHLARTLIDFICLDLENFDGLPAVLEVCLDNFHLLCVEAEGRQPSSTYITKGIVIQKEFLFASPTLSYANPVKFVVLHLTLDRSEDETKLRSTYVASDSTALNSAIEWKTLQFSLLVKWLKFWRVDLILCSKKVDDVLNGLCSAAKISTVQFVDAEELNRIEVIFGISAIDSFSDLVDAQSQSFIGSAESCEPTIIGGRQFVYLSLPATGEQPCDQHCRSTWRSTQYNGVACPARQLIVHGMSAGACRQVRINLHNSIKVLRAWTDGGQCLKRETDASDVESVPVSTPTFGRQAVHIHGGGTFELAVYGALQKFLRDGHQSHHGESFDIVCRGLCAAMTAVPIRIMHNSYNPSRSSVADVERLAGSRDTVIGINGRTGKQLQPDSSVVEPIANKVAVLSGVLELTEQLLRLDLILGTKRQPVTHKD
jgi:chaperonin GroEL (HSP60 family)